MTHHRYPTLLVAALAAAFVGAAVAQTQSNDTSRMPANKGMAQESQTQPSTDPTDKMKGQEQASPMPSDQKANKDTTASDQKASKDATASDHMGKHNMGKHKMVHASQGSEKDMKHGMGMKHEHGMGMKSKRPTEEAATTPDEKAYREALRDCAKQQDQSQRDSCLDSAIEKFHRNA